jgi:hypothetical protein
MQDLSPDMEDLLRRASEAYPLKKGEDRWEDIAPKILQNRPGQLKQRLWWKYKKQYAFLLLFGLLFSYLVVDDSKKQNKAISQNGNKYTAQPTLSANNNKNKIADNRYGKPGIMLTTNIEKKSAGTHLTASDQLTRQTSFIKLSEEQQHNQYLPGTISELALETFINPYVSGENFVGLSSARLYTSNKAPIVQLLTKDKDNTSAVSNPIENKFINRGVYYGVISGIHRNAIKNQAFKKTGFDAGVIAGYRFNSALSVETGLLFSKNFYWTQGKYFNIKEVMMPAGMELLEVHGSSNIIEVPFHLRFHQGNKVNRRFYSSAGFSSYILTNESNQYYTLYNGVKAEMNGAYKKNRNYFAGTLDFGLGYERAFGKRSLVRVEPYLQLPLTKIGIGHLPMKTAGLRIAFTRTAH